MSEMETPYLDNEIGEIELWVTLNPNVSKSSEAKLAEYQQIKAALKRLEELEEENKTLVELGRDLWKIALEMEDDARLVIDEEDRSRARKLLKYNL